MKEMNRQQLESVKGGFSVWAGLVITAIVIFVVGIVDGFVHPKECE